MQRGREGEGVTVQRGREKVGFKACAFSKGARLRHKNISRACSLHSTKAKIHSKVESVEMDATDADVDVDDDDDDDAEDDDDDDGRECDDSKDDVTKT